MTYFNIMELHFFFLKKFSDLVSKWVKADEEILALHRDTAGKERSNLISFSNNCGYFSLIPHQNSTSFLKVTG